MIVYLIKSINTNLFKIGTTKNSINERITQLQTGNADSLIHIDSFNTEHGFKIEKLIHAKLKIYKVKGEWFELPIDIVNNFKKLCIESEDIFKVLQTNTYYNSSI